MDATRNDAGFPPLPGDPVRTKRSSCIRPQILKRHTKLELQNLLQGALDTSKTLKKVSAVLSFGLSEVLKDFSHPSPPLPILEVLDREESRA